jgi:hypothetical protein
MELNKLFSGKTFMDFLHQKLKVLHEGKNAGFIHLKKHVIIITINVRM